MRRSCLKIGSLCGALALVTAVLFGTLASGKSPGAAIGPRKSGLTVHEWGTFLSMQGSDGVSLGGMVDSEEELPVFVESRMDKKARMRALIRQKMETPVTYFYTDRPLAVEVRVEMPQGTLTHWFPVAFNLGPDAPSEKKLPPAPSFIDWGKIQLVPDPRVKDEAADISGGLLRKVHPESTWRFARETDSAFVKVHAGKFPENGKTEHDFEKFLFYRGLGTFDLPLVVRSQSQGTGTVLSLGNRGRKALQGLVLIQVEKKTVRFALLGDLAGDDNMQVNTAAALSQMLPLDEGVSKVKGALSLVLVEAGLYPKEAAAMVNTWEKSYFRTEGLRILCILPRENVDSIIPVKVKPEPEELVRVMVGRVEVLTPAREVEIEKWILDLSSEDRAVREEAKKGLARLGRFEEPVLRRIEAMSLAPQVVEQARSLIEKGASSGG